MAAGNQVGSRAGQAAKPPRGTAWDAALRYLGQRDHARLELAAKLERRGFSAEETADALERLDAADLLDDSAFARRLARQLLEGRHLSEREVHRRLTAKGVSPEVAEEAIATSAEPGSDFDRALVLAQRKLDGSAGLDTPTAQRRLLAYLARRGFSSGVCYAAYRAAREGLAPENAR